MTRTMERELRLLRDGLPKALKMVADDRPVQVQRQILTLSQWVALLDAAVKRKESLHAQEVALRVARQADLKRRPAERQLIASFHTMVRGALGPGHPALPGLGITKNAPGRPPGSKIPAIRQQAANEQGLRTKRARGYLTKKERLALSGEEANMRDSAAVVRTAAARLRCAGRSRGR